MKTVIITKDVYQFSELSDNGKEKAIEKLWDLNVDYDWWEFTYNDAEEVGIKITGFDLDRGRNISGELLWSAEEVCKAIIDQHGESCDTYKTAQSFLTDILPIQVKQKLLENDEDIFQECEDEIEQLAETFKDNILNCYWKMLREEYEYQTSEEAIIETIEANEYEFEEDGSMY